VDAMAKVKLVDLVDVKILQEFQDVFAKSSHVATGISDEEGEAITSHALSSVFCGTLTKGSEKGLKRCEECDLQGALRAHKEGKAVVYKCHAGLIDFAAPIIVNGQLNGTIVGGQVTIEPLVKEKITAIAEELGIDPEEYWRAAQEIPVISREGLKESVDYIYSIAQIISNIATNEYQMLEAKEEVEAAAKMKSDFLANMSHEIRTPMNAVIGMADMALRENLPPVAREYISQIKRSGKTLLAIINDILDFSKIESGKMDISMAEYSPMEIISDVANIIATRVGDKDVEIILDISPNLPGELMGDSVRIKQIITNLANNAVKFTREGQVVLKVDSEKTSENSYEMYFSVKDTGIGIKKANLAKIFESFRQVDSKRNRNIEGTGLGLAISKQLVELMGGELSVESEYEVGSTFSFHIKQLQLRSVVEGVHINEPEFAHALGVIENPYAKAQLKKDIERLGGTYKDSSIEDILNHDFDDNIKFIFIENIGNDSRWDKIIVDNPEITFVLIINFKEDYRPTMENMVVIRKPLYILPLSMIFNHEDIHIASDNDEETVIDFIAPEARVLIIDDNEINLTVGKGLLKPLQMQVETALSGKEAIEMISKRHYDIIFMDHMMPGLDGIETTRVIRRFHAEYDNVPIVALTANAMEETKAMFLVEGMNDFIAKPIELKTLLLVVKSWLPEELIVHVEPSVVHNDAAETFINIPGLDTMQALNLIGSEKLFWDVLKNYYDVIDKKVEKIKSSKEKKDWDSYTIEVHSLKSASRQIGAISLSEKAAALERAGNERDIDKILNDTEKMLNDYVKYKEILKPYFQNEEIDDSQKEEGSVDMIREQLGVILTAVDDLDMTTMENVIEEMKKYSYVGKNQEYFKKLREAVDDFDVEACEDIVKKWEKIL